MVCEQLYIISVFVPVIYNFIFQHLLLYNESDGLFCADCFWLLDALLEYTVHDIMPPVLIDRKSSVAQLDSSHIPLSRREGNISVVLEPASTKYSLLFVQTVWMHFT